MIPVPALSTDTELRTRAIRSAEKLADTLFEKRKGHRNPQASYRRLDRSDLLALAIVAFEAGADWESTR